MAEPGTGTIFDVKRYALHDGPGIRTTVFLKGCPLRCAWCHNPESLRPGPEPSLRLARCQRCGRCVAACPQGAITVTDTSPVTDPQRCTACGTCLPVCPARAREIAGRRVTVAEVLAEVERDRLFYDQSAGGVTFSGGEPLAQPRFLAACLRACRSRNLHTAVDTSLYAEPEDLEPLRPWTDLFLCDLKHLDPGRHRALTGVDNARILSNLRLLDAWERPLWIRVPLIGGVNDDDTNLAATAALAAELKCVHRVDLLPYNAGARDKAARLGRPAEDVPGFRHDPADLARIVALFEDRGLPTHIGG